jgi:hypothetical protein
MDEDGMKTSELHTGVVAGRRGRSPTKEGSDPMVYLLIGSRLAVLLFALLCLALIVGAPDVIPSTSPF